MSRPDAEPPASGPESGEPPESTLDGANGPGHESTHGEGPDISRGGREDRAPRGEPLLHVVLYQPDIPQNTGNIGRSCVAVGAKLWLVRPLGFRLDDRSLKRAGMDYWPLLDWESVDDWSDVERRLAGRPMWLFTRYAEKLIWEAAFQPGDVLVFGSETRGLPARVREAAPHRCLRLPMRPAVRSLNLASTANTAIYEAVRQFGGLAE